MINVIVTRSMVYGCLLTICRKSRKLTQAHLAAALENGVSTVSRYELGESELTINNLRTLCVKLKVSFVEFIQLAEFIVTDLEKQGNVNTGDVTSIRPRSVDLEIILSNQYKQHLQDLLEG